VMMSGNETAQIAQERDDAKGRYDEAYRQSTMGVTDPLEIEQIILALNEAHEEILDALEKHRQLLRKNAGDD
jgi:hypothetical protein